MPRHRISAKKRAQLESDDSLRYCRACHRQKPRDQFGAETRRADGLRTVCKPCAKAYATRYKRDNQEYRQYRYNFNRKYRRGIKLKAKYGLSVAAFDAMLEAQGGRCALCRSESPRNRHNRFCVDHDHETGRVRGILCGPCNSGLGALGDSPEAIQRALDYIKGGVR